MGTAGGRSPRSSRCRLALHLTHSAVCAGHVYVTIGVGLRGPRRVRDVAVLTRPVPVAFQTLFQQGLLIVVSAAGTLLFMAIMMARLNLHLTAVALVARSGPPRVTQGLRRGDPHAGNGR